MTNLLADNPVLASDQSAFSLEAARALLELGAQSGGQPCVSIFMPTHRAGKETLQNPIRLKNLLAEAEEKLIAAGLNRSDVLGRLKPARDLIAASDFWRQQTGGLAVFIADGAAQAYRVPGGVPLAEKVIVGERFHLAPLLPLLAGDGLFYLIALSQKELRLLRCTREGFEQIEAPDLPQGEEVLLVEIEEQKALQWHTGTGPAPGAGGGPSHGSGKGAVGERSAMFHGQGAQERNYKVRIFEYFRRVAEALRRLVPNQTPIVFAGVEYLLPIFRDAAKGLNVLPQHLPGNPDQVRVSSAELHASAWHVVEPYFQQARGKAMEMYQNAAGGAPERASADLGDVVRAACDGRVAVLFVDRAAQRWGRYDSATGLVSVHPRPEASDDDLLDLAATQAFLQGAVVYAVDHDEMPTDADACALMRY